MVLYLDTDGEGSWDAAYGKYKSGKANCTTLVDMMRRGGKRHIVSGVPGKATVTDHNNPYYWFVAIADCENPAGLTVTNYHLEFKNPVRFE